MPHLYLQLRACSCIASGNEQTVAFTAAGCSGATIPAGAAGKVRGMGRVEFHMQVYVCFWN